ncbi:MAG: phage repressor protein [Campylobacteraceae bacterium]|nr:phage repressor protein [Campylobacteraceae bacterium]
MDFNSVVEKIRVHMQHKKNKKIYDSDIAKALDISKEHFSRTKKSDNIPLKAIVEFCAKENIVINYILFDQSPESLMTPTQKLITIKYFKAINTSAGWGAINDNEEFEAITIDETLALKLGGMGKFKSIEAINVTGDSMEPTIKNGSIIFIDRNQTTVMKDKKEIFVLQTPGGTLVKKLDITVNGKLKLISQNKDYDTEIIDFNEASIIGKVLGITQHL